MKRDAKKALEIVNAMAPAQTLHSIEPFVPLHDPKDPALIDQLLTAFAPIVRKHAALAGSIRIIHVKTYPEPRGMEMYSVLVTPNPGGIRKRLFEQLEAFMSYGNDMPDEHYGYLKVGRYVYLIGDGDDSWAVRWSTAHGAYRICLRTWYATEYNQ